MVFCVSHSPLDRRELRAAALAEADIIAGTFSAMGANDLSNLLPPNAMPGNGSSFTDGQPPMKHMLFDALVCDEAAQAIEPSSLIPLHLLAPGGKLVMVGDPCQLPATVLSRTASAAGCLAQSLFERCQKAGAHVVMLSQQYRMHPAISAWPSSQFYGGKLTNAVSAEDRKARFHDSRCFPPLAFFNCSQV